MATDGSAPGAWKLAKVPAMITLVVSVVMLRVSTHRGPDSTGTGPRTTDQVGFGRAQAARTAQPRADRSPSARYNPPAFQAPSSSQVQDTRFSSW